MGDVLSFDLSLHEFRKRATGRTATGAEILFFTGVRYERYEETPLTAEPRKRPSRARPKPQKPTGKRSA
jgi:hypothetical protein